jgi:hypothetical protein
MGGPGSGRKKGGVSGRMKSAKNSLNHFKGHGGSTNGKTWQQNLKKTQGKVKYLKKTGQ